MLNQLQFLLVNKLENFVVFGKTFGGSVSKYVIGSEHAMFASLYILTIKKKPCGINQSSAPIRSKHRITSCKYFFKA